MQIATAECFGTFFLAMIVTASAILGHDGFAPFSVGFGLCALIYTIAPVSGGQFNPCVSIALLVSNHQSIAQTATCIFAQIVGVFFAGGLSLVIFERVWADTGFPAISSEHTPFEAFTAEAIQSFFLALVVLNVMKAPTLANNSYFGLAVGFVVVSGSIVLSGVSGACFNPALALLSSFHSDFQDIWVYVAGPIAGGFVAGALFHFLQADMHVIPHYVAKISQEFIGSALLAWTYALTVDTPYANKFFAIGCALAALVYAGGHISGAHYNPSVTFAVFMRGLLDPPQLIVITDVVSYIVVQIAGAFVGGAAAGFLNSSRYHIASPAINTFDYTVAAGFLGEYIFTLALTTTVLSVATSPGTAGNGYYGVAIGFMVAAGTCSLATVTGGALNPAIALALPVVTGSQSLNIVWYVIAQLLAGATAAALYSVWSMGAAMNALQTSPTAPGNKNNAGAAATYGSVSMA